MLQWIKMFCNALFADVAMRLVSERGEVSIEDKGDPESEPPEGEFEKEFNEVAKEPEDEGEPPEPGDEGEPPGVTPPELDEAKVMEYLKSKGIEADSFDDVLSRHKGFNTLQQNLESKSQILKILRTARPEQFEQLLADAASAYDGKVPKAPTSLSKMSAEQISSAQDQVAHLAQPAMDKMKADIKTDLLIERFADDNADYPKYQQTMGEIAVELGITKPTKKNLATLLKLAKEQEAGLAESLLGEKKNKQPNNPKTVGLPPSTESRGVKKTEPPKTEADWEKRYDNLHKKAYG